MSVRETNTVIVYLEKDPVSVIRPTRGRRRTTLLRPELHFHIFCYCSFYLASYILVLFFVFSSPVFFCLALSFLPCFYVFFFCLIHTFCLSHSFFFLAPSFFLSYFLICFFYIIFTFPALTILFLTSSVFLLCLFPSSFLVSTFIVSFKTYIFHLNYLESTTKERIAYS